MTGPSRANNSSLLRLNLSRRKLINSSGHSACSLCGFERRDGKQPELNLPSKKYEYNKNLHDNRYYYPNRCEGCDEYSSTQGDIESGEDSVFCNIGGEVRADTGCSNFKADITATCTDCWNYKKIFKGHIDQHSCDIHGQLDSVKSGFCSEYVCKCRTELPIPVEKNCIEVSRSMVGSDEYPRDPAVRTVILDAMSEVGLSSEAIRGHNCCNCRHETSYGGYIWGDCSYHNIFLICQDDRCCEYFEPSVNSSIDEYPEIIITATLYANGTKYHPINNEVALCAEKGNKFSLVEIDGHKVLCVLEDYLLRSVQYSEEKQAIVVQNIGKEILINPKTGQEIILNTNSTEKDKAISWMDAVTEDEYFEKVNQISKDQRHHGVYSGDRRTNCERCNNIVRDSSYPNGSPSGLKCDLLNVFVTANGACDNYTK